MEFAATALASLGSTLAAGAGTAAGGAAASVGGLASIASAGGGFLSSLASAAGPVSAILGGGASILQMMNQRESGVERAFNFTQQALDVRKDIGAENIQGQDRRASLKRALLDTISERDAAFAASGIDTSFGTPAVAREQAVDDAERALSVDDATTQFRVARLNERAGNLLMMARSAKRTGNTQAAITGIEGASRVLRRG